MKSDNTEAITHIDRQIDEFEELLKELTSSKALLTSTKPVPPPPLAPGERRRGPAVLGMPMMSEEERQRNEQKIQRERQRLEAPYQAARRHQEDLERKYDAIYDDTEYALSRYFSPEGVLKQLRDNVVSNLHTQEKENDEQYRRDPRRYLVFGSPSAPIECEHYIQASKQCISTLRNCRRKIETFGIDTQQTSISVQGGDLIMKDKYENRSTHSIGDISKSTGITIGQGKHNTVIATQNAAGQTELAQALQTLTDAVLASQSLSDDDKKEHVEMIDDIGKEAAKPKANKRKLKSLADGLLATLKAIPDVAKAVTEVMPLLNQLHL